MRILAGVLGTSGRGAAGPAILKEVGAEGLGAGGDWIGMAGSGAAEAGAAGRSGNGIGEIEDLETGVGAETVGGGSGVTGSGAPGSGIVSPTNAPR